MHGYSSSNNNKKMVYAFKQLIDKRIIEALGQEKNNCKIWAWISFGYFWTSIILVILDEYPCIATGFYNDRSFSDKKKFIGYKRKIIKV